MARAMILAALLSVAVIAPVLAQSRSVYDWQSGNMYTVTPGFGGGANVQGFNTNTGSMWNTRIDNRGNMNGMDSHMNPWSYDAGSKTYMNYGTGRMCVGEGYARTCF